MNPQERLLGLFGSTAGFSSAFLGWFDVVGRFAGSVGAILGCVIAAWTIWRMWRGRDKRGY